VTGLPRRAAAPDAHSGSTAVVSAVTALRRFAGAGCDRATAQLLLGYWVGGAVLSHEQRAAVLDRFVTRPEPPGPGFMPPPPELTR
jgi:hypothetical protein